MFLNLSGGKDLYILDVKDRYKLFVGQVVKVTPSIPRQASYNPMAMYPNNNVAVDIIVKVNGEDKEFQQIPSNLNVADFSPNGFVLIEDKKTLIDYLNTTLQNSESILASVQRHTAIAEDCKALLVKVNPALAVEAQRDNTINELKNQVNTLTEQLSQVITALNSGTKKE